MPLYEFHCPHCQKDFTQALTLHDYEQKAYACPDCKSKDLERVFENVGVITSKKS
jgi:putative FmdB family regulatory protein